MSEKLVLLYKEREREERENFLISNIMNRFQHSTPKRLEVGGGMQGGGKEGEKEREGDCMSRSKK